MQRYDKLDVERREYIRLDSVFPVLFRLLTVDGSCFLSDWLQGFTNNVGKGGMCLSVNNLNPEFAKLLKARQAKLSLSIEMPLSQNPLPAQASVIWIKNIPDNPQRYIVGLSYEKIDALHNQRIIRYAWGKKLFVPLALSVIILLGSAVAADNLINVKLIRNNKALVDKLVKTLEESRDAEEQIGQISKAREVLELKIQELQLEIKTVKQETKEAQKYAKLEADKELKKTDELNKLIKQLAKEKASLEDELLSIQRKQGAVSEELREIDRKRTSLVKANLDKMYKWLKVHQNPRTGLVMSFEGDSDISNWAFIYDQALVAQIYSNSSDFDCARKIFDFFKKKAKTQDGQFFNAYYVSDGSPAEYVVQSGPNIWLGIAIMQYTKKAKDTSYVNLAEELASGIMELQSQDKEGGIRGGPNIEWYSTEHNLDAYAFFNMLYKLTGKARYLKAADKVLGWLVNNTYDKPEVPIKRGKGDSTIATDTYAWSIAAIGPKKLEELGMNQDRIIEFAEQNCSVEVFFVRPEGRTVKIKGFDFAPHRNAPRGQIVSSEWTAQMVMAYKIMADFYYKKGMAAKANAYAAKAEEYLSGLTNMIISSPSASGQGESCLPYATSDFVDTGHGWFTPKGKSTGSVAGTAYMLFAYYNYNPLELKD